MKYTVAMIPLEKLWFTIVKVKNRVTSSAAML